MQMINWNICRLHGLEAARFSSRFVLSVAITGHKIKQSPTLRAYFQCAYTGSFVSPHAQLVESSMTRALLNAALRQLGAYGARFVSSGTLANMRKK